MALTREPGPTQGSLAIMLLWKQPEERNENNGNNRGLSLKAEHLITVQQGEI